MNYTILRLNKELYIMILSVLVMLFTFISGYGPINNIISFLFVVVKALVFISIPLIIYLLEKNDYDFRKIAGIYTGYFIINLLVTIVCSIFMVGGRITVVCQMIFDLVNLVMLLSALFIFVEQVFSLGQIKNKVYTNTVMKIVYLVANFVSYPFLLFIDKRLHKDREE